MSSRDTLQSKVARACGGLLRSRTLWRVRSLRVACAPCPMRGARKTAPRIHAAEAGAGTTANRRRSWPQHSRTPQARAPPRFRARRENLRRIDSAAVLAPRKAAKENPARLQACGVYRWGGVGCWPAFAPLCDNRRVPQRRLTCWAGPSTRGEVMPYDRTSYRSAQSSVRSH